MWYLVALLSCLGVLHAEHPQCFCPKTEKLLPSVLDFSKVFVIVRSTSERWISKLRTSVEYRLRQHILLCSSLRKSIQEFLAVITAKVSEVMRKDAEGFQPLKITDTRVIKPENTTTFSDIVYTKGERGWFGVTPNPGTRFILEGMIRISVPIGETP
ncbi:hypothetical protein Y032_0004g1951 [Ancylostoma ceylanicum]|uniref:Uncharacterized protein n=1 Tax=Ancylostoma ceylanicum TaxID=53326 RepID=A0A016VVQ2_9BILA|nr:hypothetical protein Y032_0004g1951 [Ancylostoma ceylanicum]